MNDQKQSLRDLRLRTHLREIRGQLTPTEVSYCQQTARSIQWQTLGSPSGPGWKERVYREVWTKVNQRQLGLGRTEQINVNAMVQWILWESYRAQMEELKDYARKISHYNRRKEEVRDELHDMLNQMMDWDEKGEEKSLDSTAEQQAEWLVRLFE